MNDSISILLKKIQGARLFIFDLDGTVVDLEDLNFGLFHEIIREKLHEEISNEEYQQYISGRGSFTGFEQYLAAHSLNINQADDLHLLFLAKKQRGLHTNYATHVRIQPGVVEFLSFLKNMQKHTALATSTGKEFSTLILTQSELSIYFELILDREDVAQIKPDPEIFNKALQYFQTKPGEAIVFEDSINGIQAAHSAGIFCVGIHNQGRNDAFISHADAVIEEFTDLSSLWNVA